MSNHQKHLSAFFIALFFSIIAMGQKKDTAVLDLDEVVISFNKWEQNRKEVPNMIEKVNLRDARLRNPQTTADLLGQIGSVFIQKSQLGGGSPMIRGFRTSSVLIRLV